MLETLLHNFISISALFPWTLSLIERKDIRKICTANGITMQLCRIRRYLEKAEGPNPHEPDTNPVHFLDYRKHSIAKTTSITTADDAVGALDTTGSCGQWRNGVDDHRTAVIWPQKPIRMPGRFDLMENRPQKQQQLKRFRNCNTHCCLRNSHHPLPLECSAADTLLGHLHTHTHTHSTENPALRATQLGGLTTGRRALNCAVCHMLSTIRYPLSAAEVCGRPSTIYWNLRAFSERRTSGIQSEPRAAITPESVFVLMRGMGKCF